MYRTGTGKLVNADLNGAANIRKVETQLGLSLVKVCRQALTLATRQSHLGKQNQKAK